MATQVLTVTPSPEDILPFPALEATLANGLRVIILATGFPNIVSLPLLLALAAGFTYAMTRKEGNPR